MTKLATLAIVVSLFLFFAKPAFATRSITITPNKSSLYGDETMTVAVNFSGFTDGETIYFKGAFFNQGSTNYFGYTQKGDSWIKNGETTLNQKSVVIGSWDGNLQVKSDFTDSGFTGEGDYSFKVGFYYLTSGGNLSAVNWSSNISTLTINQPDPTPTPQPTPSPTPTPAKSPSPIPTPLKSPSPTPPKVSSPSPLASPVLGASTASASLNSSPAPTAKQETITSPKTALTLIGSGFALIGLSSGFYIWYSRLLGKDKIKDQDDEKDNTNLKF